MPKRNTYHNRGDFFWAKQEENETPEDHWRNLVSLEKDCEFKDIKQDDLLISKFITSITGKKLREKLIREKTLILKTTVDLVTQDSYDKRHKQSTIPSTRKRKRNKRRTNTRNTTAGQQNYRKNTEKTTKNNNCGFCRQQKWSPQHKCPTKTVECNKCHKIGHFARVCRSKTDNARRQIVNYLEAANSEKEESEPEEIQQITQTNKILPDKNDNYGIKLKINGKYQNFTIDTGFPVTIMPNNPKQYNPIDIHPLKERYQDVNQKRDQVLGNSMGEYRIQRRNQNATNTYHTKRRHHTITRCELASTFTKYRQQNPIGRTQQPIHRNAHKIPQII